MIEVKVPGKLFLAGEYAVVHPGYPSVLIAVDQFLTIELSISKKTTGTITSEQYKNLPLKYIRKNGKLVLDNRENPFEYILHSLEIVDRFAHEHGLSPKYFDLVVKSELDNQNGRKYGLGSSAAVTVATVRAATLAYGFELSDMEIYKLSALAHFDVQQNGSTGDIAASTYTGWIAFSTFEKTWLSSAKEKMTLTELLDASWPGLSIERLPSPKHLRILIGWTGKPASTSNLVAKIEEEKNHDPEFFENFLSQSKHFVEILIDGLKQENFNKITEGINGNRELLRELGVHFGVAIETETLGEMITLAKNYRGVAKSSGAGGGDCGFAIFEEKDGILDLVHRWKEANITPLPLSVYTKN
jgi:phosphomevalonate kinase